MKRLYFIILVSSLFSVATAQRVARAYIPHGAFFYNSQWQGVSSADKASYYRVLAVDDKGQKMFYDYYITGQLQAEKHYISINKQNDRNTVLNGVCRTFHKSGRVESVLQYKNEMKGGKDHYIDKNTNEDEFCERYRHDETLIMAQSKSISKARENVTTKDKNGIKDVTKTNTPLTKDSKTFQPAQDNLVKQESTKPADDNIKKNASSHVSTVDKYVTNIKYPDSSEEKVVLIKKEKSSEMTMSQKGRFNFAYLHSLLSRENERLKGVDVLTAISHNFLLNSSQIINGFGTQKEVIFHHNMIYDVQNGKDKVTGTKPRQIGYFGTIIENKLLIERINIFTWSEEEMYLIAQEAIKAGYKTLGDVDYKSENGNFILEPNTKSMNYDEHEIIVTFTHQPDLYAGLYHIQMDIR